VIPKGSAHLHVLEAHYDFSTTGCFGFNKTFKLILSNFGGFNYRRLSKKLSCLVIYILNKKILGNNSTTTISITCFYEISTPRSTRLLQGICKCIVDKAPPSFMFVKRHGFFDAILR